MHDDRTRQKVCQFIADGMSLKEIAALGDMPSREWVHSEILKNPTFADNYAKAKEAQMERMADDLVEIADEIPLCEVPLPDGTTTTRVDSAAIQRNRLRVDTRKWLMSKLKPKKYGERQTLEHTGEDGGPITFRVERMG